MARGPENCLFGRCIADIAGIAVHKNRVESITRGITFTQSSIYRTEDPERKAKLEQSLINLQNKLGPAQEDLNNACSGICSMCPHGI